MNSTTERWRDVPGFKGQYMVSDHGRVWSRYYGRWKRPRVVPGTKHSDGYLYLSLHKRQSRIQKYYHQLVMLAFVGPCPDGEEVRHLDGNPANNHLSNLAYGTRAMNLRDMVNHGRSLRGSRNPHAKLRDEDIAAIRSAALTGISCTELGQQFHVSLAHIWNIIHRKRWAHVS
jgi:hypothetical protein